MTATPARAASGATPVTEPSRWSCWSDRLNPILVREVKQAIKGRVFGLAVLVALLVIVSIAANAAGSASGAASAGRDVFHSALATLIPLVAFVVPMQAFQSMRLELRAGIAEQLLLSRLRPLRILLGKLQAAMVQFVLYVAVIAPLLATSYLLRGVDVPTIAVSMLFAVLLCVTATTFAVSSAAQAVVPALQPLANLATAFGLGMATFGLSMFALHGEYVIAVDFLLRSGHLGAVLSAITLVVLALAALALLIARSYLLHAFENRATPFRVWLFVAPACAWAWLLVFLERSAWPFASAVLTFVLALVTVGCGFFMVTEQQRLSPRVRAYVPRGRLAGLLATPLLPGRDRGFACFVLAALPLLVLVLPWTRVPASQLIEGLRTATLLVLAYAFVYLALGRLLRARLPESVGGNNGARLLLPVLLFLMTLLPILIDVFTRGEPGEWHLGHVMNPFFTIQQFAFEHSYPGIAPEVAWSTIAVVALLHVPAAIRGLREVWAAGAARPPALAEPPTAARGGESAA